MTAPAERHAAAHEAVGDAAFTAPDYRPGEVVHIVLFRFRPDASAEERAEVKRRFLALGSQCLRDGRPYIRDVVGGEPNGGEGAERGFEQGFVLRFASEGDRNYYIGTPSITDPAHEAFKRFVGPLLAHDEAPVLVFDFASLRP